MLDEQELYWTRMNNGVVSKKETEKYLRKLERKIKRLEEINECHKTINGELIQRLNKLGE